MKTVDPLQPRPSGYVRQTRQSALIAVLVASLALGGLIAFAQSDPKQGLATASGSASGLAAQTANTTPALGAVSVPDPAANAQTVDATATTIPAALTADTTATTAAAVIDGSQDLDESAVAVGDGCVMADESVRFGSSGDSVACLQHALAKAGFYTGSVNGTFDQATDTAVRALQTDRELFVDGVAGRESGISLDIWPAEGANVIHTPAPPAGAKDSMGFKLSSVSSTGSDAPPLPPNSGTGKRLVYERAGQRVWAVSSDEVIIRSWLVSGSKYSNETPGTHQVYSKSEVSTAWNGKAYLPNMVRWLKTDIGHIGFHGIPTKVSDGSAYQTEAELGQRLSGGCQRQANPDAAFVWAFAEIGTKVVVI